MPFDSLPPEAPMPRNLAVLIEARGLIADYRNWLQCELWDDWVTPQRFCARGAVFWAQEHNTKRFPSEHDSCMVLLNEAARVLYGVIETRMPIVHLNNGTDGMRPTEAHKAVLRCFDYAIEKVQTKELANAV